MRLRPELRYALNVLVGNGASRTGEAALRVWGSSMVTAAASAGLGVNSPAA